jgi:hypothetical protein
MASHEEQQRFIIIDYQDFFGIHSQHLSKLQFQSAV